MYKKLSAYSQKLKSIFIVTILAVFAVAALLVPAHAQAEEYVYVKVENTTFPASDPENGGEFWDGVLVDTKVPYHEDSTMMSSIVDALATINIVPVGAENNYISEINGLGEFDGGPLSGWMGTLNGWFTNAGFQDFSAANGWLQPNDEIHVMYTRALGDDLGGSWGNRDKRVKSVEFTEGVLDKEFDQDVHEYTLTVPGNVDSLRVRPTAVNKNYQVKTFVNDEWYRPTVDIPLDGVDEIVVKCGDPSWAGMNPGSEPAQVYTFNVVKKTQAPILKEGVDAVVEKTINSGQTYSVDLSTIFEDPDSDTLSYTVSIDGAEATEIDEQYSFSPTEAKTYTLVFQAHDEYEAGATYTVKLSVNLPKLKLDSLLIHKSFSLKLENILLQSKDDSYEGVPVFDPDTLIYDLGAIDDSDKQLRFRAILNESDAKAILHYGDDESKDITYNKRLQWANLLVPGKNTFKIVTEPGESLQAAGVEYTFNLDVKPTFQNVGIDAGNAQVIFDKKFSRFNKEYEITIPDRVTQLTFDTEISYQLQSSELPYSVTYNGSENNVVDIANKDSVKLLLTAGESGKEVTNAYTFKIKRIPESSFKINATPEDAIVQVYDGEGNRLQADDNGVYSGLFNVQEFTYTVTKVGYVGKEGVVPSNGGEINVTLDKAPDSTLKDVTAYWPNFRGNDVNMGITDVALPTEIAKSELKWNKKLGQGWGNAPSVQIIVDDSLIVMSNKNIYKLDLETGEILQQNEMVMPPDWGYTPPTYAEGMIFAPLSKGHVQAFNAETLESLWVYKDPLGGQSLSPIAYSDGYIYTSFWNARKEANFVALSITDEDPLDTHEAKIPTWKHAHKGGFYWAGAIVLGDYVIVGSDPTPEGHSILYSFNKYTGEIQQTHELSGEQRSTISYDADRGRIYFTTKEGRLYSGAIDIETGIITDLKNSKLGPQSTTTPLVYKDKVYMAVGGGVTSVTSENAFVVADADTLEKLYSVTLRGYPQGSMLLSTAYEDEGYLYVYTSYNEPPGGITMIKIDPTKNTVDGVEKVEIYEAEGFEEYCITSLINGPNGTIYYKNDSCNVLAFGFTEDGLVEQLIDKIGEVTLESEPAIQEARDAYDALPEEAQRKVRNYLDLLDAEKLYQELLSDAEKVAAVEKAIDKIGDVEPTNESKNKIDAARKAFDSLPTEPRNLQEQVANKDDLEAAEAKYLELKEELDNVVNKIDALPENIDRDDVADVVIADNAFANTSDEILKYVNADLIDRLETAKDQAAVVNHTFGNVTIEGLPWDVFVEVDELTNDDDQYVNFVSKLNDKQSLLDLFDVVLKKYQINSDGSVDVSIYENDATVKVTVTSKDVAKFSKNAIAILHEKEDGSLENVAIISVDGNKVTFNASNFSLYGVVANVVSPVTPKPTDPEPTDPNQKPTLKGAPANRVVPKTGDMPIIPFVAVGLLGIGLAITGKYSIRKNK